MPIKHYVSPKKTMRNIALPFVAISLILAIGAGGTAYAQNSELGKLSSYTNEARDRKNEPNNSSSRNDETDLSNGKRIEQSDSFSFNPCDLEEVECEGTSRINGDEDKGSNKDDRRIREVAGYSIDRYATLPTHEATVKAIYDAMPEIKDKFDADAYIKSKRPNSPVRGGMVERAAKEYDVDMKLMLALMQNDSAFGTAGLGAKTRNPGNIANRDDGHTFTYPSWEDGVRGVARWISKHKI